MFYRVKELTMEDLKEIFDEIEKYPLAQKIKDRGEWEYEVKIIETLAKV